MNLKIILLYVTSLVLLNTSFHLHCIAQKDIIDLQTLKSIDPNWEIILKKSDKECGRLTFKSQKWLMYFVHWWELTDHNRNISGMYADSLLQNLWGMPFKSNKYIGKCTVNGHEAYFAEATLRNAVQTRFVVWNCEETNRQFVADCNINLLMNTPKDLLKMQYGEITPNFQCHGQGEHDHPLFSQYVEYPNLDISFYLPDEWKSSEFLLALDSSQNIPGFYPEGVTSQKGSVWNLLTDSEKLIDLFWWKRNGGITEQMQRNLLIEIESDTLIEMMDTIKYISVYRNFEITKMKVENQFIQGEGTFEIIQNVPAYQNIDTTSYLLKFELWENEDQIYFLLTSMIAYGDMWGQPIDLTPSQKVFETYTEDVFDHLK